MALVATSYDQWAYWVLYDQEPTQFGVEGGLFDAFTERGTRMLQEAILLSRQVAEAVLDALDIQQASVHMHANFAVQMLARVLQGERLFDLARAVVAGMLPVSRSQYGCRVVQRLLERSDEPEVQRYVATACVLLDFQAMFRHKWAQFVIGMLLEEFHGAVEWELLRPQVQRVLDEYLRRPLDAALRRAMDSDDDDEGDSQTSAGRRRRRYRKWKRPAVPYAMVALLSLVEKRRAEFSSNMCDEKLQVLLRSAAAARAKCGGGGGRVDL
jgi:hypothetical protein